MSETGLPSLLSLLRERGRQNGRGLWSDIARLLEGPRRRRAAINVGQISRKTRPGELAVVPGKVLAAGSIAHPVTVAALGFSAGARQKLAAAGGRCLSLAELARMEEVSGARILR